jgi:hypothetical protein
LTRVPLCGDDHRVRFLWEPQGYTRTCAQCGSTWHVPRSVVQLRSRLVNRFLAGSVVVLGALVEADSPAVIRTLDSISERNRLATASRRCPHCHADHFWQGPG